MTEGGACCAPARDDAASDPATANPAPTLASQTLRAAISDDLIPLKGGFFEMGGARSSHAADLDSPPRRVRLSPFRLAATTVTNRQFQHFVAETGYVTTAEREGWSFVFHLFLANQRDHPVHPEGTPWWRRVDGACWHAPEGPCSTIDARLDHPVVHISWHDAQAFCAATGTTLPTEAQWEFAARAGRRRGLFPWGNALVPVAGHQMNVWQGRFPFETTAEDGFTGTAPVTAFAPNAYGFHNLTGNVWEWCADGFGPLPIAAARRPPLDPKGPSDAPAKVMRGGSYLCHASYCERYFVHSRTHNTADSTTGHIGFRVAAPGPP